MRKEEFLDSLQDILQCDLDLEPQTALASLEEWDSLAMMGLVAFFDRKLGKPVNFENLGQCSTVADLLALADIKD